MRLHNLDLVMKQVLAHPDGVSRADLSRLTGLTRSTSSRLVQDLLDARLVTERPIAGNGEPGRPATPVTAAPATYVGIGATVNLDYLAVKAVDLTGNVVFDHYEAGDFRGSDAADILRDLGNVIRDARAACTRDGMETVGAALGLPGLIDIRDGDPKLHLAPNLGWRHIDPATYLAAGLEGLPKLCVDNDANLQAYAAAHIAPGAPRGLPSFLYVSGDVGVGGAVVLDDVVFRGSHGWAGELGHTAVDANGPECTCGARGCLEMYVGKRALNTAAGLEPDAPVEELVAALERGDALALGAVEAAGRALGVAIGNALNLLDVSTIVFGTGIARIVNWLRPHVIAVLETRLLARSALGFELLAAELDDAPAATGAAYFALVRGLPAVLERA